MSQTLEQFISKASERDAERSAQIAAQPLKQDDPHCDLDTGVLAGRIIPSGRMKEGQGAVAQLIADMLK